MKNICVSLVLIFFMQLSMKAHHKLSLADVSPGNKKYQEFVPNTLEHIQWWNNSIVFLREDSLFKMRPATQKESLICTLHELNLLLKAKSLSAEKKFPLFLFTNKKDEILFQLKEDIVRFDAKSKQITELIEWDKARENRDYCKANNCFAFTEGNDLFVLKGEELIKINEESLDNVLYGQAVHRDEFGISKGTFWSPKGHYLAFYRMDESMVADYVLFDQSNNKQKSETIKYPEAGKASHHVTIGVFSLKTGKTIYLETGEPFDRFFTNLQWSPDEKELYVAELNRAQNECTLKAYSVASGIGRVLFVEKALTYVEPEQPVFFLDSTGFVWQSERTGHNHLYLYSTSGELIKPLTSGHWDVLSLDGYNKDLDCLIISTTEGSSLDRNVYSVNIKTGERKKLSVNDGQHTALISSSARFLLDAYSAINIPRKIDLIDIEKGTVVNLLSASDPYLGYDLPQVNFGTIKAADGLTDLHYRMSLPYDFDSTKTYPVIIHVYGGPHVQMVQNAWLGGSKGWELYMTQKGYVMFTLDNRGSMNRGQAFEEAVFKNIGKVPMEDQLQGLAYLKTLPYVDSTRVGVYGWSFGGFMSTQLMCKAPKQFKVGVAGGAVIDWRLYEVMYGERYMQTPEINPDGYSENDLTVYAKDLEAKFLMIHCELDPVVRIINAERFLEAADKAGKQVEFIRYEKHKHNVLGKERVGLFEEISKFFIKNL